MNTVHRFSIWEIAHRWQNLDPESTDPKKLPLAVQDTLRSLAGAYHYDDLMIVNSKGIENKGAYHAACVSFTFSMDGMQSLKK